MDCEELGYLEIYDRTGHYITLNHEKTLELCEKSNEEMIPLPDIIKKYITKDLKMIKFRK